MGRASADALLQILAKMNPVIIHHYNVTSSNFKIRLLQVSYISEVPIQILLFRCSAVGYIWPIVEYMIMDGVVRRQGTHSVDSDHKTIILVRNRFIIVPLVYSDASQ